MAELFSNNASTTISGALTSLATTINLAAGDGVKFPSPTGGDYFRLFALNKSTGNWELMTCTARVSDVLTVTRSTEGTSPIAFNDGDPIELRPTAYTMATFLSKAGGVMTGDITMASDETVDGRDLSVDGDKLDLIDDGAEVTSSEKVNAAGAVMESDSSTAGMSFVIDEDDMASDSNTVVPTQQSVKKYVDDKIVSSVSYQGGYDASANSPNLDSSPSGILIGYMYTVTAAGTFFTIEVEVGDTLLAEVDDPSAEADWTVLQKNLDASSIKIAYESNANTNAFLDAYKTALDNLSSQYLRSDAATIKSAGNLTFNNNIKARFGTSGGESSLYSDGSDTLFDLGSGDLIIREGSTPRFTFDRATGTLTATGDVSGNSDERLKDDIRKIENALTKVLSIGGYTFSRIDLKGVRQAGVLAGEIAKVLPEVVHEDSNGIKSVAYGNLSALLIEAIKELSSKVGAIERSL